MARVSRTEVKKRINLMWNLNVSYGDGCKVTMLEDCKISFVSDMKLLCFSLVLFSLFENSNESFQTFALS